MVGVYYMNIFGLNISRQKKLDSTEEKAATLDDLIYDYSLANVYGVSSGRPVYVTPRKAYDDSERNADLGNAVDMIAGAIAALQKGLKNTADNEIDYNNEIIDLLNRPGGNASKYQFWYSLAESFELTQEIYIVARGNINRPPLELEFIRPYEVNINMNGDEANPQSITTQSKKDRRVYRKQIINGVVRYIDRTELNELFVIRGAISIHDEWRGRSPLARLYYDLLMNTDGKRHNTSLLKNGVKSSVVLSPATAAEQWPAAKVRALQDEIRSFNQGAGNAGTPLIIGASTKVDGLSQTNKDMDFLSLLKNSTNTIYNLYKIPLPLVTPDNMTYGNYTTANRTFYTKAVFPVFEQIAAGLMACLGNRFNIDNNYELSYNSTNIKDLQTVIIEDMKELSGTNSVAPNEVRRLGGFKDVSGGDDVLISANLMPLSMISASVSFADLDDEGKPKPAPADSGDDIEIDEGEDDESSTEE